MVTSQPSLAQLLEALRPNLQAPVVAQAPAVPPPIHIPNVVAEGKEEVGSVQIDGASAPLVSSTSTEPLVDSRPRMRIPRPKEAPPGGPTFEGMPPRLVHASDSSSSEFSSSASSSSSSSTSSDSAPKPPSYSYESLNAMNLRDGPNNLMEIASSLNIVGRWRMGKLALIHAILRRSG